MIAHSTIRMVTVFAGVLLLGGIGLWWGLMRDHETAEKSKEVPKVADVPEKKEGQESRDTAPEAEKRASDDQIQQLNGTWNVVSTDGQPPAVKLPNGDTLQKPAFYRIDKNHLTWVDEVADDPTRHVKFKLRSTSRLIGISLGGTFQHPDLIIGAYDLSVDGERLLISWSSRKTPAGLGWLGGQDSYSIALRRVHADDADAAVDQKKIREAPDLRALQGQWRIIRVAGAQDADVKLGHRFLFQDGRLKILHVDTDDIARPFGPVFLKARVNPKQIIFHNQEIFFTNWYHETRSGIYRIDKDRLEICWSIENPDEKQKREMPNKFEVGNDAKVLQLILLERVDVAAEKPADANTRLLNLQGAIVRTLQSQVDGLESRIQSGIDSTITIFDAYSRLMEAQLALATDKKSRMQVIEASLQRLLMFERFKKSEREAGRSSVYELAQARAKCLMAEIVIENERANVTAEKPADEKARLTNLRKSLIQELQAEVDGLQSRIRTGKRYETITVLETYERFMRAQLAQATDKKSRIQIIESNLQNFLVFERLMKSELENGGEEFVPLLAQAKARCLMVEILLENERVDAAAEKPAGEKSRLTNLRELAVSELQAQIDAMESRWQGSSSTITILDAYERLVEAQLALARDRRSRIQVIESGLQRSLRFEKLTMCDVLAGKATPIHVAQVKAKRLLVEILLETEKSK